MKTIKTEVDLSTDIIVGFPGETDEEFEMTMEAVQKVRFDSIYSFKYSPRPGTQASKYTDQISEKIKSERLKILLETQGEIVLTKNNRLIGSTQEILIENKNILKDKTASGRSRGNHLVKIYNCDTEVGELLQVKIIDANKNFLTAEPLSKAQF